MKPIEKYSDIANIEERKAADYALEKAIKEGATQSRVMLNMGEQSSFNVLDGELDVLQGSADRSLYIQIYINGKYGSYSTNIFKKSSLDAFIKNAVEATRLLSEDYAYTLPDKSLYYKGFNGCTVEEGLKKTDLGQFDPMIYSLSPAQKREIALEVYNKMDEVSYRGNKTGALISGSVEYADSVEYFYMKDSQGFKGESLQTTFNLTSEVSVKGRNGARPESWWYESTLTLNDFLNKVNYRDTGATALKRAQAKLNPKKIKGGTYSVVIDRTCSSRVIAPVLSALSGANLQQKNSFLLDCLGKSVFSPKMSLIDRPLLKGMSGSRYFDSEGVATADMDIICRGRVEKYFINTYYSKKLGMPAGVEGASVPILTDGGDIADSSELIKLVGRGVFITGFNGGNCNQGTGDFSFGIEGFYFESGEIKFPVKELNITGNIISLWNNFIASANDARKCTRWQIGSLAFENVNI